MKKVDKTHSNIALIQTEHWSWFCCDTLSECNVKLGCEIFENFHTVFPKVQLSSWRPFQMFPTNNILITSKHLWKSHSSGHISLSSKRPTADTVFQPTQMQLFSLTKFIPSFPSSWLCAPDSSAAFPQRLLSAETPRWVGGCAAAPPLPQWAPGQPGSARMSASALARVAWADSPDVPGNGLWPESPLLVSPGWMVSPYQPAPVQQSGTKN